MSGVKTTMQVTRPDDVEVTLSITMTVKDWSTLREQLAREYPSWRLSAAIVNLVEVKQSFEHREVETS
jgi:hypothetical protein